MVGYYICIYNIIYIYIYYKIKYIQKNMYIKYYEFDTLSIICVLKNITKYLVM